MRTNDAIERASRIAQEVLAGTYDPLLACRELVDVRSALPPLPDDLMDIFVTVDSEIDGWPLGDERAHWAPDSLRAKDLVAGDYRTRVGPVVLDAARRLLADGVPCWRAFAKVERAVLVDRCLPRMVLAGDWDDVLFFDPDWMTDPDFVTTVKTLLAIEDARCACVWNIDTTDATYPSRFFVRAHTTAGEYRQIIVGAEPGLGWLPVERLACASDGGGWCIYAEPYNDLAVFAVRNEEDRGRYAAPLSAIRAVHLADPGSWSHLYGLSVLPAQWRDDLVREYVDRVF